MSVRTVIAGWGYIGPTGAGRDAVEAAFARGELPLQEVDRDAGYHRERGGRPVGARLAASVPAEAVRELISARQLRRMSPPSRFAVAAAKLARGQWAALPGSEDPEGDPEFDAGVTAVLSSTSFGPSSYTEELLRQIFLDQPTAASPFLFTEAVANAPAAQVALDLKARGPNITITQREAGPILALGRAKRLLESGRADQAVVVAVDELNPLLHAALDRFGALAGSRSGAEVARPFDRHRSGFVLSEGATAVILETEEQARLRGLEGPLWWLRTQIGGFDPSAPVASWGRQPERLAADLRSRLDRQGIDIGAIDAVVCAASGSQAGDLAEASFLRALFGRELPPVIAPKAFVGEQGGSLLAGALWLLEGGQFALPPGFQEPDPACDVVPFGDGSLAPRRVLVGALAVGGAAAWTILERIDS